MSTTRFKSHGPLGVSADRTHLVHADGTPFFFMADTAWNGALLSTEGEWETYLDDRAAKGFSAIQFITHAPWTAAMTNAEGLVAFNDDPRRPINEAFFDRIEKRMEAISARGMLAVPVLAWAANFGVSNRFNIGHTASTDRLIEIVRYQVQRLGRHDVLWILGGDGVYNCLRARKWKRVGRAVFGDRPVEQRGLVTLHPAGFTWPYSNFGGESWIDLYGYQSGHSEHRSRVKWHLQGPAATYWRTRPRPVINLEPAYESLAPALALPPFDDAAVRRAAWWSMLISPTAGVSYGAHGLWGWHDRPMEALNHFGMGMGQPWHVAMHLPGSTSMKHLAAFFTGISWWQLRPDAALLEDQPGRRNVLHHQAGSRSDDGTLAVIYTPAGGDVRLNSGRLKSGMKAQWFNPRDGQFVDAGQQSGRWSTPGDGDWVLVLKARD